MRETPQAAQAWNDYLAMGPDRSLEKLAEAYQKRTDKVPTRQLSRLKGWSTRHNWQQRLLAIAEAERQAIVAKGIADKQNRVDALNDRWARMRALIAARAEDIADEIPGGDTGLMVRQAKLVKVYNSDGSPGLDERGETLFSAKRDVLVYEYVLDAALLKELREHEKQAAVELGEWSEKRELTGKDGAELFKGYVGISPDDWPSNPNGK